MDHEVGLQKEMFAIWLRNLRKKSAVVQSLAEALKNHHGMQGMGTMLAGFAADCEKLYELGYEVGYVQGFLASEEKPENTRCVVN